MKRPFVPVLPGRRLARLGNEPPLEKACLSRARYSAELLPAPTHSTVIQGKSGTYAVSLSSTEGFSELASLCVSGFQVRLVV